MKINVKGADTIVRLDKQEIATLGKALTICDSMAKHLSDDNAERAATNLRDLLAMRAGALHATSN